MEKTAVEWLANELYEKFEMKGDGKLFNKIYDKAKEMEKQQGYSEEEVIAFGEFIFKHTLLAHSKGVKNLFEQFKKK
jgi:hypothetical protein